MMSLLWTWVVVAMACPTDVDETVSQLIQRGDVPAYHCMVSRTDAEAELVARIPTATEQTQPRLRRALVFTLLKDTELPWTVSTVALLSPADRRLLADGVKARRGRKSPSELHHRIFENWDWYRPKPGYTDNVLKPVDRANIAMADDPEGSKGAVAPPTAAPAMDAPDAKPSCGCVSASPIGFAWMPFLLGGFLALQRKRR